eukprot:gb/GEZN01002302.1/.p1 GENE.gb/GEZN01002302.1/~~gb/GEZN01002302.1/.p1  ORF type:complete len:845 (-),score=130.50 gb/GEZN01002302.1/:8-2518(-)
MTSLPRVLSTASQVQQKEMRLRDKRLAANSEHKSRALRQAADDERVSVHMPPSWGRHSPILFYLSLVTVGEFYEKVEERKELFQKKHNEVMNQRKELIEAMTKLKQEQAPPRQQTTIQEGAGSMELPSLVDPPSLVAPPSLVRQKSAKDSHPPPMLHRLGSTGVPVELASITAPSSPRSFSSLQGQDSASINVEAQSLTEAAESSSSSCNIVVHEGKGPPASVVAHSSSGLSTVVDKVASLAHIDWDKLPGRHKRRIIRTEQSTEEKLDYLEQALKNVNNVDIKGFKRPSPKVLFLEDTASLHQAIQTMQLEKVTSLAVMNDAMCPWFLDMLDVLTFLSTLAHTKAAAVNDKIQKLKEQQNSAARKEGLEIHDQTVMTDFNLRSLQVRQVMQFLNRSGVIVDKAHKLADVLAKLTAHESKRVFIRDRERGTTREQFIGVLSQTDILRYLDDNLTMGYLQHLGDIKLNQVLAKELKSQKVTGIPHTASLQQALQALVDNQVSSLAVTDAEDGHLVADLTHTHFKAMDDDGHISFGHDGHQNILDYLHARAPEALNVLTVTASEHLADLMHLLSSNGLHHVWMVEPETHVPKAHISLTDIMVFLMQWVPQPTLKQKLYNMRWKISFLLQTILLIGAIVCFMVGLPIGGAACLVVVLILCVAACSTGHSETSILEERDIEKKHLRWDDCQLREFKQFDDLMTQTQDESFASMDSRERIVRLGLTPQLIDDYAAMFQQFDVNKHGCITIDDLLVYMRSRGMPTNLFEVKEFIAEFDLNGDGVIDFDEYLIVMAGRAGNKEAARQRDRARNKVDERRRTRGISPAEQLGSDNRRLSREVSY